MAGAHTCTQAAALHHHPQAATTTLAAAGAYALTTPRPAQCESSLFKKKTQSLPEYSAEEVAKHNTRETRVWVTYKVWRSMYCAPKHALYHAGGRV